jgi:hypothetical protein
MIAFEVIENRNEVTFDANGDYVGGEFLGYSVAEKEIPDYAEVIGTRYVWEAREHCQRCGGAGGFKHWPGFTCFDCGGMGRVRVEKFAFTREGAERSMRAKIAADTRREAARIATLAKRDAAVVAACGLTFQQVRDCSLFVYGAKQGADSIEVNIAINAQHGLSYKQCAVLAGIDGKIEKAMVAPAAVATLPAGRCTLRGQFVSMKWQDSAYGSTLKGLFVVNTDAGDAKVWMTVPNGIGEDDCRKDWTIKVSVEPSADAGFHFGKRPALA